MVSLTTKGNDGKEIIHRTAQFRIDLSIAVIVKAIWWGGEKYKAADMLEVLGAKEIKKKCSGFQTLHWGL